MDPLQQATIAPLGRMVGENATLHRSLLEDAAHQRSRNLQPQQLLPYFTYRQVQQGAQARSGRRAQQAHPPLHCSTNNLLRRLFGCYNRWQGLVGDQCRQHGTRPGEALRCHPVANAICHCDGCSSAGREPRKEHRPAGGRSLCMLGSHFEHSLLRNQDERLQLVM